MTRQLIMKMKSPRYAKKRKYPASPCMYPFEKTVMRKPIPVTTQSMTAVKGSMNAPASAENLPALIQSNHLTLMAREFCGEPCQKPAISTSSQIDKTALAPTPIQIGQCDCCL